VDFLAQIELTMDCQQDSILSMEIAPAALRKRIARVVVCGCGLFWESSVAKVNFSSSSFRFTDRMQASLKMHEEVERLRFSKVEVTQ
jgi:hypothetical protein